MTMTNCYLSQKEMFESIDKVQHGVVVANNHIAYFTGNAGIPTKFLDLDSFLTSFDNVVCDSKISHISEDAVVIIIKSPYSGCFSDSDKQVNFEMTCKLLDDLDVIYDVEMISAICDYPYNLHSFEKSTKIRFEEFNAIAECIERINDTQINRISNQISTYLEYYAEILQINYQTTSELREIFRTALSVSTLIPHYLKDDVYEIQQHCIGTLGIFASSDIQPNTFARFYDLSKIISEALTDLKIAYPYQSQRLLNSLH